MESIFAGMTGSKEEARQLALDFYGPIFLLYSLYDSAEEKNQITDLLDYSIQQAAKLECRALCFEGNIDFYGKSGFRPASEFEIRYHGIPDGEDASFFLCRELIPGYLKGITGVYAPPSGYLVAPKEVEKFAKKQLGGIILWIT